MEKWFILTLLATLFFAFGSFFGKLATFKDIPYRAYFFEWIGTLMVFVTFVAYNRNTIFGGILSTPINYWGILMGISWGLGTVLFIVALKYAKLSLVTPLSAVYPAVTVLLALIFLIVEGLLGAPPAKLKARVADDDSNEPWVPTPMDKENT